MTHRVNWDDLRILLAIADHGSVASAARSLGVNHTTVLRRMHAFEEAQKIRLFDRLPTGYALTAEGEQLVAGARSIDDTVAGLERRITGRDLKLEGVIRMTTTDTFMTSVLSRHLASFREKHPRITIELALTNNRLSLTRRDADVAIRPARELPSPLVGVRAADVGFGVYGADHYVAGHSADPLSDDHVWLGGDEMLVNSPVAKWMEHHVPNAQIGFRADSFVALKHAVQAGMGLAILPCCLVDGDPSLTRLETSADDLKTHLWVLTHEDLIKAARIRAFVDHMTAAIESDRAMLSGRGQTPLLSAAT
jgi:DNA-binding transcriptional LysR family regulator